MLCHRLVYWDNCGVVRILRTIWCSWMAAHHKEQYREFALDEVATWVSKHSVQKTSTAAFEQILLTEFCQYDTLATLQNSVDFQSFICPRENVVLC